MDFMYPRPRRRFALNTLFFLYFLIPQKNVSFFLSVYQTGIMTTQTIHYDYLIIGADAAGLSAAVQITSAISGASAGILEKGEIISYGACGLPYAIQGIIPDFNKLIHFTPESFSAKNKATVHTATEATGADFTRKIISATDLKTGQNINYTYNKLLIATGAEPVRLPFPEVKDGPVYYLKTVPDGKAIRNRILEKKPQKAVIIGGGYIGLEMADVLTELGISVKVIDLAPEPVIRLPSEARQAVLKKMAEKNIEFCGSVAVRSATVTSESAVIHTNEGDFPADLVIVSVGIKPATSFLESSGLAMEKGAILTDTLGRTNIDDVYTAGDCALVYHQLLGKNVYMPLGSTANKQGRIAGQNMAGISIHFPGIIGTQVFKFFNIAIAKTGLDVSEAESIGLKAVTVSASRPGKAGYYPGSAKTDIYLTVNTENGEILGGMYIGPVDSASMIDTIGVMAQARMKASEMGYFDAAYAPPVAPVWNALISAAGKYGRDED